MARAARRKAVPAAQLQLKVDAIKTPAPRPAVPAAPPPPLMRSAYVERRDLVERPPFGGWLTRQPIGKSDAMDLLIKGSKLDPAFPKSGDPDDVRKHLGGRGADPDVFEAIDDAELAWLAY